MSSSTLSPKFLLDENVPRRLFRFMQSQNLDVTLVPKSSPDAQVAAISLNEKRIFVTNDEDFSEYPEDKIFAVIWLRVPQNNPVALLASFEKLIHECRQFSSKLIMLKVNEWEDLPLFKDVVQKKE